jgi:C_GCAxxG_C_C family probable redox protein
MEMDKVSEDFAADCFRQGMACSQIVMGYAAGKVGLNRGEALKIASAFGGGMGHGRTCGALTGALMALGMKYGYNAPNMDDQKKYLLAKRAEFEEKFTARNGSVVCREILGGLDMGKPEEASQVMEKGLYYTVCTKVVCSACDILDEMII